MVTSAIILLILPAKPAQVLAKTALISHNAQSATAHQLVRQRVYLLSYVPVQAGTILPEILPVQVKKI